MCTVTYLPDPGLNKFILTSSRDEKYSRSAAFQPKLYLRNDIKLIYPKDPDAGGTWIAISSKGTIACLLNGAFEAHIPHPPYKKSRGLVLLDSFDFKNLEEFIETYSLESIEPFTIVFLSESCFYELRWDGFKKYFKSLDCERPQIWSSATLYPEEIRLKRECWFKDWLSKESKISTESIRKFHHFGGDGDINNDIRVNRNNLLYTVSITSIEKQENKLNMIYEDLINKKTYSEEF